MFAAVQRIHYAVAAAIFLVALCVFILTLAPSVAFIDSGSLTVAAWSGGVAHPPGFPLYLMLTKLVMLLPVGSIAWRANLASALFAAAACAMTALVAAEAILQVPKKRKKDGGRPARQAGETPAVLAMILAGSLMIFGRTLWGYATVAEVYALNAFLIATIIWLMLRWRRTDASRDLYIAAALFGLALGVHHATVGVTFVGIAAFVVATAGIRFLGSRQVLIAAVISIVALAAVYSYLPIAAARKPVLNWGDPSTIAQFRQHVTAAQFWSFMKNPRSSQVEAIATLIAREFGRFFLVPLLAIIGWFAMWKRDRALALLTLFAIAACCAWMLIYPVQQDHDAYLLPAFIMLAVAAAYGAASIAGRNVVVMAAFLALPIIAAVLHWPYRDRSDWRLPRQYVDNALRPIEQNALLITSEEQLYMPLFYYQEVEQLRGDVRTLNWELLMRVWYVEQMQRKYPVLFDSVSAELDAFRPHLVALRDNLKAYQSNSSVRQVTNDRYDDLILAIIRAQIARGAHVYLTHELAFSRQEMNRSFVQRLVSEWDVVPVGIAAAILPKGSARPRANTPIDLAGLVPPAMKYEADDPVSLFVIPSYRDALLFRARHLAFAAGDLEAAASDYRQALALDPGNERIRMEQRAVEAQRGR